MAANSLKEQATGLIGSAVLGYLDKDPDAGIPKLLNWWDKLDRDGFHANQRARIRSIVEDPDGNWFRYMRSLWTDVDTDVRKTLFKNLIVQTFLIATAEQREFMYHQIRAFRKTKPLFTMDFWNDGEFVNGCIAGGRYYLHINANGDIEPCAFIHYSDSNIHEKTLLEAYQSPLFMGYRLSQPFNENHLRPCPLLDNPGALTRVVEGAQAESTDMQNPENVRDLSAKCACAAASWAPVADRLWSCRDCAGAEQRPEE